MWAPSRRVRESTKEHSPILSLLAHNRGGIAQHVALISPLSCQVSFDEGRNNHHGDIVLVWRTHMAGDPEHTVARLTVVAIVAVALLLIGSTPVGEAPGVTRLAAKVNGCATNIDLIIPFRVVNSRELNHNLLL